MNEVSPTNPFMTIMEKFLEFENNSRVLEYRYCYRQMLIWPFIRCVVLDSICKTNISEESGIADNVKQNMGRIKLLSYKWLQFFKFRSSPLFCKKQSDIIFFRSSTTSVKDDTGVYYDRVHDIFEGLYENTAIIESAPLFKHHYPQKHKIYEADFLEILCLLNEKFAWLSSDDKETIHSFMDYLKSALPFRIKEEHWRIIQIELERYAKNNRLIYQYYKKCFSVMRPKLVFVTTACYGNHSACKIKLLNDLGIPSAEIQHGLVSFAHTAYNYSDLIFASKEYQEYMPNTFLAFGKFWMDCVRLPIEMRVLGSSNFYKNTQKRGGEQPARSILVLPMDTESYLDLVTFLAQKIQGTEIIVKIHPLLRDQYQAFRKLEQPHLKVYIEGNIYDYLSMSSVVIGDSSTVLYEAAALEKVVMIWNSEYSIHIDKRIGHRFEDKYDLLRQLQALDAGEKYETLRGRDIFDPDIKTNYLNFIEEFINVEQDSSERKS